MKEVKTTFVATHQFDFLYGIEKSGGGWNCNEKDLFKKLKEGETFEVNRQDPSGGFPLSGEKDITLKFYDETSVLSCSFVIGLYVTQGKIKQVD